MISNYLLVITDSAEPLRSAKPLLFADYYFWSAWIITLINTQLLLVFCGSSATDSAVHCVETALLNCAMTCTEDNREDCKALMDILHITNHVRTLPARQTMFWAAYTRTYNKISDENSLLFRFSRHFHRFSWNFHWGCNFQDRCVQHSRINRIMKEQKWRRSAYFAGILRFCDNY